MMLTDSLISRTIINAALVRPRAASETKCRDAAEVVNDREVAGSPDDAISCLAQPGLEQLTDELVGLNHDNMALLMHRVSSRP